MSDDRPNILWIGVDEWNRSEIGPYGARNCSTPRLDAFASESMVFDNAFCTTAVCSPSRASMLTGKLASEGSVVANETLEWTLPYRETHETKGLRTWAEDLRANNYRTVHVGKWHLYDHPEDKPSVYGFEGTDFAGYGKNWWEPQYHAYRKELGLNPEPELEDQVWTVHPVPMEFDPKSARLRGPEDGSLPAFLAHKTIEYLDELGTEYQSSGKPFFLRCEFWGPHMPCYAPEPYYSAYDPGTLNLPENFWKLGNDKPAIHSIFKGYWGIGTQPIEVQRKYIAAYLAYASAVDERIGLILEALERNGLADNTIVMFTADHGDMLGAHCLYDKGPFMYDEIYRVPLMVRWPGKVPPRRSDALVYNMDLAATIWDLLGQQTPTPGSARSLLPLMTGDGDYTRREFIISEFWHHFNFFPQAMVHSGKDKFVYNFADTDEYYDHAVDPGELENRIGDGAIRERVIRMREYLRDWMKRVDSPMLGGLEATLPGKNY